MSEFAVARQFAESVLAACNALDMAAAAEERARFASIAAGNANNAIRQAEITAEKLTASAKEDKRIIIADLRKTEAESRAKLAAEKAEHDRYVANAKGQVEAASETLNALQLQIATTRAEIDSLNTTRASIRAAIADAALKI